MLVAVLLLAPALVGQAQPFTAAQFRADLQYFARELPRRHRNAFHFTTWEQFQAAVDRLAARLDSIDQDAFFAGLKQIASMIGDAHTNVNLPPGSGTIYPIVVRNFDGAYRVMQALNGYEKALGTKLVRIDDTPATRFYELLSPLASQNEHPNYAPALVNVFLRQPELLHGAGVAAKSSAARFTFEDDSGSEFALDIPALPPDRLRGVQLVPFAKNPFADMSEPMHTASPTFSYTYAAGARAVYASVRSMKEVKTPARELFRFIRERDPDKLIIDLRQNPGGNYFHGLHSLIEPIARLAGINRKGHLFVLIGPLTGSAAIVNASQFHTKTQAILVGEPIGAKPTEYTELRTMKLPNTQLVVGYSVRFYDFAWDKDNVIRPDQEIRPTWEDAVNGRAA